MVDIILSCKNSEQTIEDCISSIFSQSYKDFNLYIFDDASCDNTVNIVKKFKDKRLTLITTNENIGTYASKNFLFKNFSKSKYVALHDADDTSQVDRLKEQFDFLESNTVKDVVCVGTGVEEFWEMQNYIPHTKSDFNIIDNKRINLYPKEITRQSLINNVDLESLDFMSLLKTKMCMNGTVMFRRESLLAVGGWDGKTHFSADSDIFIRLLAIGNISNLQKVLYRRRFHDSSLTMNNKTGIGSSARESYNKSILEDVKSSLMGNVVKRSFYFPRIQYEVFSCAA